MRRPGAAAAGRDGDRRDRRDRAGKGRRGHRGRETPVPGVRGEGGQRNQHRAPVLRAGEDRARADRRPAVDPPRAHRGPGQDRCSWGCRWTWRSAPRGSWPSTSARRRTPTASGFDFACGDEVYGSCTQLREFFEARGQAYVLRVPSNFTLALAAGTKLTCARGGPAAAEGQAALGGPLRGPRLQGPALVRLGVDRHRLAAPPPAGPPPPQDRRAGLPLLLRARRAAPDQGPADPRRRAADGR